MPLAYIALGSNLGDPLAQLWKARLGLGELGEVALASSLYRTAPVGGPPGQADYLNVVVALKPNAPDPETLLDELLALEAGQGRTRAVRWAARTLDLDLLAWDNLVLETPRLTLPHPRMLERAFVLGPLCELSPDWRHPLTRQSACETLASLDSSGITRTALDWTVSSERLA